MVGDLGERVFISVRSMRSEHKRTRLFEAENDRLSILGSWKDQAINWPITLADLKAGENVGEMIFSMVMGVWHMEKNSDDGMGSRSWDSGVEVHVWRAGMV